MKRQGALDAYNSVRAHTAIADASPHQLVLLLMQGAIDRMNFAKGAIRRVEIENRTKQINKAVDIIGALKNSLDMDKGEDVAMHLDNLYAYILIQLGKANAENNADLLDECIGYLVSIKDAWAQIAP